MNRQKMSVWLAAAVLLMPLGLPASSLRYSGQTRTEGYAAGDTDPFFEVDPALNSDFLLPNATVGPDATHISAITGHVSFGRLSSYSHVGGAEIIATPDLGYFAGLGVAFTDSVTIHGASTGFLSLDISFDGQMTKSNEADSIARANLNLMTFSSLGLVTNSTGIGVNWINQTAAVLAPHNADIFSDLWAATTVTPNGGGYRTQGQATVLIPFVESNFDISFSLGTAVFCHIGCVSTSDFANTLLVGGARILDASMVEIPGAFLTTGSGHDYAAAVNEGGGGGGGSGEVPEPGTWMMAVGGIGMIVWRKNRRR
ncbi:MAG: PEP-CTERM sorting domain-containing protein [Acidobacteriota bacterium]